MFSVPIILMVFTLTALKVIWEIRFYKVLSSNKRTRKAGLYFCYFTVGLIFKLGINLSCYFSHAAYGSGWLSPRYCYYPSKVRRSEAARVWRTHIYTFFSGHVSGVSLEWNLGGRKRTLSFCFSFASDAQFNKQRKRSKDGILTRPSEKVKGNLNQLLRYLFSFLVSPSPPPFSHSLVRQVKS